MFRESQNDTLYLKQSTTCRRTEFTFLPSHNRQMIICNATYYEGSKKQELTKVLPITMKFAPIFDEHGFTQNLTESNSLELNVTFTANPCPEMRWYLFTDKENDNLFEISSNHTKYTKCLHHLYGDRYTASLQILNVEKEDYQREFKLSLANPHGSKETHVKVIHLEVVDTNEGFWLMMLLIGLGAVILFIFLFVVIWIVVRKRRGITREYTPPQQQVATYVSRTEAAEIEMESSM